MLRYTVLFCILCSVSGFNFKKPDPICDEKDSKCILQVARNIVQLSVTRIEELGVESLDPLHQELIEKDLPDSECFLINSTATGLKDIILNDVILIINKTQKTLRYDIRMTVPHFEMTGKYKYNGKINNMVVEGDGKYKYIATNINLKVDTLKEFYKKDGKPYLKLTDIRAKVDVLGSEHFKRKSESKEFSEPVLKFENENPKFLVRFWQDIINLQILNKMFDNINKILTTVSLDELITVDSYIHMF